MEGRIRGSFPGGPSRPAAPPTRSGPPRLKPVADIEEGLARRNVARRHRRRYRRIAGGLGVAMALSAAIGGAVGWKSHRTQAELVAERTRETQDLDISKEINRTLLNLWKMEDVEAIRNLGRSR